MTLKDIAKVAGVSISTVSKALNNSTDISKETRASILKIAKELNYDFNLEKNDKENEKSKVIGVICPEINSNYYTQLISSIGEKVTKKGYNYIVAVTDFKQENEGMYLELFKNQGTDGILLITENEDIANSIGDIVLYNKLPVVFIATSTVLNNIDCLKIDDYYGVVIGIEHLIKLGHKKICYIGDHLTESRLKAYTDTLIKNNVEIDKSLIKISEQRFEACGYSSMKSILSSSNIPTAVFAAYDDIAIGAMKAILEHGLSIPEDISIIGMDNVTICPYLPKRLTTVSNPIREMAEVSVSILIRKVEDNAFTVVQHVVLKPELIIRETTASFDGKV